MSLAAYIGKQSVESIKWNEPADGILSYRYPTHDLQIRNGCRLTVSESQMVAFAGQGKIAGVFGPGQHTLDAGNMPVHSDLPIRAKETDPCLKSDVYFFSTRMRTGRKWGTAAPVVIHDREFGAVRLRCFGTYSYQLADPCRFFEKVCGTRGVYFAEDLENHLRNAILMHIDDGFADSDAAFLDLASNQSKLAAKIGVGLKPVFAELGLELTQFVVESVSLPEELALSLNQRVGRRMAANAQRPSDGVTERATAGGLQASWQPAAVGTQRDSAEGKSCVDCGLTIPVRAKYCLECGKRQ